MNSRHPKGFIEQALVKVYSRGDRTVRSVADDLNVNYHTLKNWMKGKSVDKLGVKAIKEKRPHPLGEREPSAIRPSAVF